MRARISYLIAAGFAALIAIDDVTRVPKVFSLIIVIRATVAEWFVVLLLLVIAIAARDDASEKRTGILIGASLVVAPFAVMAIAFSFSRMWPWVASALAAAAGDAMLARRSPRA
jgi:hypothetical protein